MVEHRERLRQRLPGGPLLARPALQRPHDEQGPCELERLLELLVELEGAGGARERGLGLAGRRVDERP